MATRTFTTFKLNGQLFGIEVLYVREINKQIDLTPVQHAPQFIRGLVNLRGQIVTVMDLIRRLTPNKIKLTDKTCNLILKTDAEIAGVRGREQRDDLASSPDPVGLLVDEIQEIVTVDDSEIDSPPNNIGDIEGRYLSGVVKLDGALLGILSVDKVLAVAA